MNEVNGDLLIAGGVCVSVCESVCVRESESERERERQRERERSQIQTVRTWQTDCACVQRSLTFKSPTRRCIVFIHARLIFTSLTTKLLKNILFMIIYFIRAPGAFTLVRCCSILA